MRRSALVQVPATSANLGPGFDSLGVAVDWVARVKVIIADEPLPEPEGPIARMATSAARALFERAGAPLPDGIRAETTTDLPVGRGLGTSAAARSAGVVAADALIGGGRTLEELLPLVARLEGHADNAAPAMLGGLRVVVEDDDAIVQVGIDPPPELKLAVLIPDFSMPTEESRKALPASLTRNQAVHNIGRAALLVAALQRGRFDVLNTATEDILHQPARGQLFPAMFQLFQAARDAGACGVYLSGGGSTIAAFAEQDNADRVAGAMREAAAARGLAADARVLSMSTQGATLISVDGH